VISNWLLIGRAVSDKSENRPLEGTPSFGCSEWECSKIKALEQVQVAVNVFESTTRDASPHKETKPTNSNLYKTHRFRSLPVNGWLSLIFAPLSVCLFPNHNKNIIYR